NGAGLSSRSLKPLMRGSQMADRGVTSRRDRPPAALAQPAKSRTTREYAGTVVTGFAAAFVLLAGAGSAAGAGSVAPSNTTEVAVSLPVVAGFALHLRSALPAAE